MIARRLGVTKKGTGGIDANTLLVLHGEDFTDSSLYPVSLRASGTVSVSSEGKFGKSLYFNGGYLSRSPVVLGTSDFTIDFWVKRLSNSSSLSYQRVCSNNHYDSDSNAFYIDFQGATNFLRFCPCGSGVGYICDSEVIPVGQWTHCAFVKSGGTISYYKNGILKSSTSASLNLSSTTYNFTIGATANDQTQTLMQAYLDEFRVSNIARWTSNFTPPTEPYSE